MIHRGQVRTAQAREWVDAVDWLEADADMAIWRGDEREAEALYAEAAEKRAAIRSEHDDLSGIPVEGGVIEKVA